MPYTLKFWSIFPTAPDPVVTWNYTGASIIPQDFPAGQVNAITTALSGIAGLSTLAASRLNNFGQDIRIAYASGNVGQAFGSAADPFIVTDTDQAAKAHFFNSYGKLVQANFVSMDSGDSVPIYERFPARPAPGLRPRSRFLA